MARKEGRGDGMGRRGEAQGRRGESDAFKISFFSQGKHNVTT